MMNCYSITTRWEFGHEVKNPEKWKICEWVTKHNANANDDMYACVTLHDTNVNDIIHDCVAPHDAHTCNHIHWASCAFSQVGCRVFIFTHTCTLAQVWVFHVISMAIHVCGLFTLIFPFYFLLCFPHFFLFLNYMKSMVNLHNSCNEGVDASDDLLLSTSSEKQGDHKYEGIVWAHSDSSCRWLWETEDDKDQIIWQVWMLESRHGSARRKMCRTKWWFCQKQV